MRESNFELLRIVSMTMIVLWHFVERCIIDMPNRALISVAQCGISSLFLPILIESIRIPLTRKIIKLYSSILPKNIKNGIKLVLNIK